MYVPNTEPRNSSVPERVMMLIFPEIVSPVMSGVTALAMIICDAMADGIES